MASSSSAASPDVTAPTESLTCAICLDLYKDPHLLSCFHSFCKDCLSTLQAGGGDGQKVTCPVCRRENSSLLLPNTVLADSVEKERRKRKAEPNHCSQCESTDEAVVSFCVECDGYLCGQCESAHKKMVVFKSHSSLIAPDQATDELRRASKKKREFHCQQHPDESLRVYCEKCENVICRDCALYFHQGHSLKPAKDAANDIKRKMSSKRNVLQKQLGTYQRHSKTIAHVEKHVTTYPDKLKGFIVGRFDQLTEDLKQRKQVLLEEVDAQYNTFSKVLWAEKSAVEGAVCSLEASIKFADHLDKTSDDLEVALLGSRACASMKDLEKLKWDPSTVKSLGPLAYMYGIAGKSVDEHQIIGNTGNLVNVQKVNSNATVTFSCQGYADNKQNCALPCSSRSTGVIKHTTDFTKGGTFCILANVSSTNISSIEVTASVVITQGYCGPIPCTVADNGDLQYKITFATAEAGKYSIKFKLCRAEMTCEQLGELMITFV